MATLAGEDADTAGAAKGIRLIKRQPAVVEQQRGVLEITHSGQREAILEILRPFRYTLDGERVYMAAGEAQAALKALEAKGIFVATIDAEIAALPEYKQEPQANSHFDNFLIPDDLGFSPEKAQWKRYSFASRRFLKATPSKASSGGWNLFLREGQIALAADADGPVYRPLGYYMPDPESKQLARCKAPQEALAKCHRQSLPAKVHFRLVPGTPYVALFHSRIYLPPEHRRLLYERLVGSKPTPGQEYVSIHASDLPAVQRVLGSLGITLEEGQPPEKTNEEALRAIETAADAIQQAYRAYLKNEERVDTLASIGQARAWEKVEDEEFRETLTQLSNRAYDFEPYAVELLTYIANRLPYSFAWKSLAKAGARTLEGIALSAGEWRKERPGAAESSSQASTRYCKLIVQEFGLVLGVATSRSLMAGLQPGQVEYFVSEHWRATPYAGRLKFTGQVLSQRVPGKQAFEEGYSYICGIPSIEAQLAHDLYLSAFFLDRDGQYWKGHHELSRYFSGHGKLVEKMVADFDEPAALFQDVFGNYFYLKFGQHNYLAHKEFIEDTNLGSWKRFVAHSGLRAMVSSESGLPTFDLGHGSVPKGVGYVEVAESAILGILGYYGQMAEAELMARLAQSIIKAEHLDKALGNLKEKERIVVDRGVAYYRYAFCTPADRVALAARLGAMSSPRWTVKSGLSILSCSRAFP